MRLPLARLTSAIAILCALATSSVAWAVGFDTNDFIIASSNIGSGTGVYTETLALKGTLPVNSTVSSGVTGDGVGRVVVGSQGNPSVSVFNSAGMEVSTVNVFRNLSGDVKVTAAGNYIVATSEAANAIKEYSPAGALVRTLGNKAYRSAAVLPGNILWAGLSNSNTIDVFDLTTGLLTSSLALSGGQNGVPSMFYSKATNSVLLTSRMPDDRSTAEIVFERDLTGALIRSFATPAVIGPGPIDPNFVQISNGVTRGPGGDVYATDRLANRVARWQADGTFMSFTSAGNRPEGIIWTGAIPEPASALLGSLAALGLVALGRRR